MVVPFAILVSLIPEHRMAELIGVASIPIYLSIFIGPLLSGLLIDIFGSYRPIFVLAAISHSIGFLLLQRVKEEAPVLQAA
jgi:MFS family permease